MVLLIGTANANRNDECLDTKEISKEINLDGILGIAVDAGAGSLTVIGRPGLATAQIRGVACSRRAGDLDRISLESRNDGPTLTLQTVLPPPVASSIGNLNARLDLKVEVPSAFALSVVDTTGSMKIDGVASVEIDDGTGSIQVKDVPGLVHVVKDTSGSIKILRVGSVRIDEDGSGSISASVVVGDVHVGRDESGSIAANDVGGSFTVLSNASGGVRYQNVAGDVRVARTPGSN
ncbi:MAG: hypothetical protein AAGA68_23155 [Pseudomonadota bacterium]